MRRGSLADSHEGGDTALHLSDHRRHASATDGYSNHTAYRYGHCKSGAADLHAATDRNRERNTSKADRRPAYGGSPANCYGKSGAADLHACITDGHRYTDSRSPDLHSDACPCSSKGHLGDQGD